MTHATERKNARDPDDVRDAIEELTATVEKGLKGQADQHKELREEVEQLLLKSKRPGNNGAEHKGGPGLEAERKAVGTFARTGDETELKAMSSGSDPDGGYTVTPALSAQMLKRIYDQSPMRRLARVETIGAGDAFEEPIDNADVGATWVGEHEARPATSTPTLGLLRVPVNEIYSLQPITQRLLDDSRFDIGSWIEGKMGDKFGRSEGVACVSGNGIAKPRGFLDWEVDTGIDGTRPWTKLQYVVSGTAATPADVDGQADGIKSLYWALRSPYRSNGTWLMASSTANAIDKLKDANKDYIWRDGMTSGAPPSLLGRPVEFDENMPSIGANTFPIAFGDFKAGYLIVDKLGVRYLRDPFSDKPNVQFYAYRRVGGDVANSDAIKLLKCSV